ncbi:MAG: hydrogenase maturation protease [Pseudomonadales bacterium]|nr:hydrogenase maturation protease [Pseudomonadales bacterium]
MTLACVIGVGQPLRGDDGAGPRVIELLRTGSHPAVTLRTCAVPAALLDHLDAGVPTFIVDAVVTDGAPAGTLHYWDLDALRTTPCRVTSSHGLDLISMLRLGDELGLLPTRLVLVGIEGRTFSLGSPPSPAVEQGARGAAAWLERLEALRPQPGPAPAQESRTD